MYCQTRVNYLGVVALKSHYNRISNEYAYTHNGPALDWQFSLFLDTARTSIQCFLLSDLGWKKFQRGTSWLACVIASFGEL